MGKERKEMGNGNKKKEGGVKRPSRVAKRAIVSSG